MHNLSKCVKTWLFSIELQLFNQISVPDTMKIIAQLNATRIPSNYTLYVTEALTLKVHEYSDSF